MIIGLTGTNKTKTADIIRAAFRGEVQVIGFSDPMREMLGCLGIPADQVESDREFKGLHKSPHDMLKTLGTEWGTETIHRDLWINHAMDRVDPECLTIIRDVRTEHEAAAIIGKGGIVIRVSGAKIPKFWDIVLGTHKTELPLHRGFVAATIQNSDDVAALRREVLNCSRLWNYLAAIGGL